MQGQQEWVHASSILEPGLIKVSAGQKVRYAVIKGGVRRRHLWALMYSELTGTDLPTTVYYVFIMAHV